MFVEFSVSNFRSIGDKITLSSVAGSGSAKRPEFSTPTNNALAPYVLKSGVLFGPNAAGKSSIIKAIKFFQQFVTTSLRYIEAGDSIALPQNRLEVRFQTLDTEFEIVFIHEGELFQYGFRVNSKRIEEEWLFARHSKHGSKTRTIFQRLHNVDDKEAYHWKLNDAQLPGERDAWKNSTRSNSLFLSVAVQLNSETLRKPFEWIRDCLHVIGANQRISPTFTSQLLSDPQTKPKVESIIHALDLHIKGFDVREEDVLLPDEMENILAPHIIQRMQEEIKDKREYVASAIHENDQGIRVSFDLDDESDGTQAVFGLAGPIYDVLQNGHTLFIDELSNSLHPLALRAIVAVFNDRDINNEDAQLFFTSHETSVISKGIMHKDQIWFVERPKGLSTNLLSMSDFNVREVDAFQRSYLGGKFGALPNVGGVKYAFKKR